MPDSTPLVSSMRAWMQQHGWQSVSNGRAGSMWVNRLLDKDENRIGLLRDLTADSREFSSVVERLSAAHQLPIDKIANEVRNWSVDVTYLRAVNDYAITDSIPLSAATTMLESAQMMFRAAATAAVRVRPSINGSFSKLGDQVADKVRMGHTIRGSYVVPVLIDIGEADEPEESLLKDDESARNIETLERRATRTFAQALDAVLDHVVNAETMPKAAQIQELVARGVTREFATAVSRVLSEPAVAEIDARFEWAKVQRSPAGTPSRVEIPAEAGTKIAETARLLQSAKVPKYEIFTGPVVVVAREPEDKQTRFSIRTMRGGRPCRIETITSAPLTEVLNWMDAGTIVQVSGDVTRRAGGLQINKPSAVAAFTDLHAEPPATTD